MCAMRYIKTATHHTHFRHKTNDKMPSFELVVRLNDWQHLLDITTCETLAEIRKRIKSVFNIDLSNGEYILEIYDTKLDDYIVLTERYLVELHKSLSTTTTTTTQRLKARLEPLDWQSKCIYSTKDNIWWPGCVLVMVED